MESTKTVINFQMAEGESKQANKNKGKVLIGNGHADPSDINAQKTAGSATQENENEKDIKVGIRESNSKIPDRVKGLSMEPTKNVINFQTADDQSTQANKNKGEVMIGTGHTEPSDITVQKTTGSATQKNENEEDINVGNCESDTKTPDRVRGLEGETNFALVMAMMKWNNETPKCQKDSSSVDEAAKVMDGDQKDAETTANSN